MTLWLGARCRCGPVTAIGLEKLYPGFGSATQSTYGSISSGGACFRVSSRMISRCSWSGIDSGGASIESPTPDRSFGRDASVMRHGIRVEKPLCGAEPTLSVEKLRCGGLCSSVLTFADTADACHPQNETPWCKLCIVPRNWQIPGGWLSVPQRPHLLRDIVL